MTAISYHAAIRDVQAQPLAAGGSFSSREWFERIETTQRRAIYAVAEDASGAVVLPLRRRGRRLESLLDGEADSWRPLATPYGSLDSLLISLAGALARQTSHVVLDRLPDEDATTRQLQRAFERSGWLVSRQAVGFDGAAHPRYRLHCRRKRDPRNWPAIGGLRLRALVSRERHG